MASNYVIAGWCYIISVLLDAFDGHAARHFNQCKFFRGLTQFILFFPFNRRERWIVCDVVFGMGMIVLFFQ